jgi:hypothetical protein
MAGALENGVREGIATWLALAPITLATAIGFNVLAALIQAEQ